MNSSDITHNIKVCIGNVVNKKTNNDMATLHPDKSDKWSVKLMMFYNKYFPTDKDSYAVRLPIVALVLSLCSIQVFVNLTWHDLQRREYFIWALIVLISGATYGVHYGLKIGDRKQFTPWITLKIIEVITIAFSIITTYLNGDFRYGGYSTTLVVGFIVLGGNLFLLSVIVHRKRDDMKDIPDTTDEFSPVLSTV